MKYSKLRQRVDSFAAGLHKIGVRKGARAAIMSENRPAWLIADLAVNKLGAVSVPIHTAANTGFAQHVIDDSGSDFLIASARCAGKIKHWQFLGSVEIVVLGKADAAIRAKAVHEYDIMKMPDTGAAPEENEIASIIYTSGTTGRPKGVVLTNANFLSNTDACLQRIDVDEKDVFLSFLPLAHVLERTAGSYVPILRGASIAYVDDIKKLSRYFREAKPTIFISVPKIFENVQEKIIAKVNNKNVFIRKLFFRSLKARRGSWTSLIGEGLFFRTIRKSFGGRVRLSICGGASINESILRFFRSLGIAICEGYGLTEASPVISTNNGKDMKIGTVGKPLPGLEISIKPDKEIMVRGESIMHGYWNLPEKTREVLSTDGWLSTGDLGFMDKEGYLTIIGRKKEMIVTSNGKNISPEKLESIINLSPFIFQSLVIGHKKPYLACLVVPDFRAIKRSEKLEADDKKDKHAYAGRIRQLIGQEIEKINKNVLPHEKIRKLAIINDKFSIEKAELTPTLKVRRKIIEEKYKREIEGMYGKK